jgi:hypothetical protein
LDGGNLLVEAAKPLPTELIEQLRCHKPDIVRALFQASERIEPFDRSTHVERSAIMEATGMPPEWAQGYAALCTMPRPAAYAPERWRQLVDDGRYFLDQWGRQAAALGWRTVDCFGVDPGAPETRYDGMGLVPLLSGRRVCAIKKDAAGIDCSKGKYLTFYRRHMAAGAVAIWKMGEQ